jgi:hypothetical protein
MNTGIKTLPAIQAENSDSDSCLTRLFVKDWLGSDSQRLDFPGEPDLRVRYGLLSMRNAIDLSILDRSSIKRSTCIANNLTYW